MLHNLRQWAKQNPKFAARMRSMEKRVERARREASIKPVLNRDKIKLNFNSDRSGRKVLEVKGLSKSIGDRPLFTPFEPVHTIRRTRWHCGCEWQRQDHAVAYHRGDTACG